MQVLDKYKNRDFFSLIKEYELDDLIEFSKTVRVLYVTHKHEDITDNLGVFKIFFNHIDIAKNGVDGLKLFKENKYDLIIASTQIEELNCVEFITSIREISRHISILAISSEEKYFIDLIRLGIDGYILTPIEIYQFIQIMKKLITTLLDKEQLYNYRLNLEKMLDAKSKELIEINKNLEIKISQEIEKNRLKDSRIFEQTKISHMGEMIGNIAHQWRQPLSAISTLASSTIIENEMGILDKNSLNKKMENIILKTKYLSSTINTFKSLTSNDRTLKNVKIKNEIFESINIFKSNLNHNIRIIEEINQNEDITVQIIQGELAQIIINLLNNSKDFLIERDIKDPWIKISLKLLDDQGIVTVEDNAGGIDESIISKIFDPYFTTKHQSQGVGLGLHIAYTIVNDNLKGKISVKNSDYGAKFTIKIPLTHP